MLPSIPNAKQKDSARDLSGKDELGMEEMTTHLLVMTTFEPQKRGVVQQDGVSSFEYATLIQSNSEDLAASSDLLSSFSGMPVRYSSANIGRELLDAEIRISHSEREKNSSDTSGNDELGVEEMAMNLDVRTTEGCVEQQDGVSLFESPRSFMEIRKIVAGSTRSSVIYQIDDDLTICICSSMALCAVPPAIQGVIRVGTGVSAVTKIIKFTQTSVNALHPGSHPNPNDTPRSSRLHYLTIWDSLDVAPTDLS
ncbi:hypothetical protein B0H34DRAFT_679568 [Crassisporium funariophilum]|nr:hypothetical protein B0H34DRAFT_679568 [Crassisporium funariophilum]